MTQLLTTHDCILIAIKCNFEHFRYIGKMQLSSLKAKFVHILLSVNNIEITLGNLECLILGQLQL